MFELNLHAMHRAARRGLTIEEIEYVLMFGKRYHRAGAVFYFLREKDLPEGDQRRDFCNRLVGTAVVLDKSKSTVLTVWRNRRKGLKYIRNRPEYSLTEQQLENA
jgi:hypothetical protein